MLGVHLHILENKQPTAVRLRISGPHGEHYVPFGCVTVFPSGRGEDVGGHLRFKTKQYWPIDGRCEVKLPANVPLTIEAFKGVGYKPLTATVTLKPGQISIRLNIERAFTMEGWLSGDSRVHFMSPHLALLEAAAEDVNIVNLLALEHQYLGHDGNTYLRVSNLAAFSGYQSAISREKYAVIVNTFNVNPTKGSLALLNCHRPVFPLTDEEWSLSDWCQQCHRKGGLTVGVSPYSGEVLALAILGKVDALEVTPAAKAWLPTWYQLLNAGVRLPLIGGSGRDTNSVPLGALRTYAKATTHAEWIESVRRGESFITNGPLIEFSSSKAEAKSVVPFEKLELIRDGEVVASQSASEEQGIWGANAQFPVVESFAWIAARCVGSPSSLLPMMPVFSHTSPIYGTGRALAKLNSILEQIGDHRDARQMLLDRNANS